MSKLPTTEKIRVFSLGGVGEVGKNMYVVEVDNEMIVVDSGLMFPDDDMLGVDIVIPDISYLVENKDRVKGIVLTHGHEDHMGAVPYLIKKLNVPVYGTKLTLALVKDWMKELQIKQRVNFKEIHANSKVKIGQVRVSFFHTTHSIPDAIGVCLHTSQGAIVHTGDFKFDQNPIDGKHTEIGKLAKFGENGVLCLLSDSTNAEIPGSSLSESTVGLGLQEAFYEAEGRIIVATFASNIHRIQQVINVASDEDRYIAVVDDNMQRIVKLAANLGYLEVPEGLIVDVRKKDKIADEDLVILTAGNRGEPMSVLSQMAKGMHKQVKIKADDRVIISSTPGPGQEKSLSQTIDLLYRTGAEVVYNRSDVQTSGHGFQEDLKLMLNLLKPKYFIPVHGEYRMQHAHAHLAESCGVHRDHMFLLDKGETVEINEKGAKLAGKVPSGHVLIDGLGVGDVGNIVLRDRRLLSNDGILVVVVTLKRKSSQIISGPDIISRGFVYVRESEEMIDEAQSMVKETLQKNLENQVNEWSELKSSVRDVLSRYFYEKTKRRPMILPIIMEA
ncbi:ribonuclease J [Texcoconibacillus texcoconensis]|uniref:Ribonuclease J n=1 Tax=Texcoconibacillus texcoconensis TaxID=1095777 RepID=A0A840QIQ1_9BACI|nr:ribonuclease J [Texcoconibacillus texcoconensis]MBB5172019.1 ribonuclease J [Texcoconibacillus texcoconensis]